MTGEELERAIEFLIQSQAKAEARLDRNDQQIAEMSKQIQMYAETQSQFIQIATRALEGLAARQERTEQIIVESNARTDERIAETNKLIAEANAQIAEANKRIVEISERVSEASTRASETDARLDRLAALVERNIRGGNGNS